MDLFTDPVCSPAGVSYERQAIMDTVNLTGIEPVTSKPLAASQLVPNKALLAATMDYLRQ